MSLRSLAEGVILQSIEDLWCRNQNGSCVKFFKGDGFGVFSKLAGLNVTESRRLLRLVDRIIKYEKERAKIKKLRVPSAV